MYKISRSNEKTYMNLEIHSYMNIMILFIKSKYLGSSN